MAVILNVLGTDGKDTLRSTGAVEMIKGGLGLDKLAFDEGKKGVTVNLKTGAMTDSFGNRETVSGIEIVIGTSMADRITGSDFTDYLIGAGGNDTLLGGGGSDEIYGGEGSDSINGGSASDYLIGGQGNDTINGGAGFDMVDYSDEGGTFAVNVNLTTNIGIDTYGGTDKFISVERIRGTELADTMKGSNSANMFEGGAGRDTIDGHGGDDVIRGDFGDDKLLGGAGNDIIAGGRGNDTIEGGVGTKDVVDYANDAGWHGVSVNLNTGIVEDSWGDIDTLVGIEQATGTGFDDWFMGSTAANSFTAGAGNDTMSGGGGNDIFVFELGHGRDQINDFNAGDVLDLKSLGFSSIAQVQAASIGHDLGVLINTSADSTILLVDVNVNSLASLGYIFA